MGTTMLVILSYVAIFVLLIFIVISLIKRKKLKEYRRELELLDKKKNEIESAPIVSELAKLETLVKNDKIEEKYGGWSSKNIFELLNRVYDEFLKDNFELILKKYKDPTINFKLLRQYSNDFVKEIIGV